MNVLVNKFVAHHRSCNDTLRLGQRFVNEFIKHPWPELFYEVSEFKSMKMISDWLDDHHYFSTPPNSIR